MALNELYLTLCKLESTYPEAAFIVAGDFNKANLKTRLPKLYQHIDCATRAGKTLDHCYSNFRDAYKALPRPPFGKADHNSILLLPAYRQKLKQEAPTLRSVQRWSDQSDSTLQDCFHHVDWDMFHRAVTNNDETAYREEVRALGVWCQENNLTLNVNKTKEMIVDFRKQQREHPPIHIDGTVVERVVSFKFLGVHITDKLNWSTHTDSIVKKAQQRLFNLRRLKKFGLSPKALTNFYRCTIESILSCCITSWYGNCSAHNRKALQRVVRSAQHITGGKLPALQDTYTTRCHRKAIKIIKDNHHPSHCLFTPLSSRRRGQHRCIKAGTERLKNSFYLKAIRLLNSHH
uniref:Alkylated DNA repair protein AlkB homologue 8 N-terminal domain-containing protein n=1 Tax=Oncorhynchus tshawytscha TaxID=74940 RepID=A0AAZ3R676_ONCTS